MTGIIVGIVAVIVCLLLIVILVFKPTGLFGEKATDKV